LIPATNRQVLFSVGAIGTGRISRGHDLPGILKYDSARVMAVCDLDSKRVEDAQRLAYRFLYM